MELLFILLYLVSVLVAAGVVTSTVNAIGRKRLREGKRLCNLPGSLCKIPRKVCDKPSHQIFPASPDGMFKGSHYWWFAFALVWPLWIPVGTVIGLGFFFIPKIYRISLKSSTYLVKEIVDPRTNTKILNE